MTQLLRSRLTEGFWYGDLLDPKGQPNVVAQFEGADVDGIEVTAKDDKTWTVKIPVPPAMMSDGVHSCIVSLDAGAEIARFSIIAGDPVPDDLRGEIGLLRAELDLLKKAFRRHCQETIE